MTTPTPAPEPTPTPAPVAPKKSFTLKLSPASTRRVLRTCFQVLAALIVVTPLLATVLKGSPIEAQVGAFAAAVAAVSAIVNKLEDAGLIPAWLKN